MIHLSVTERAARALELTKWDEYVTLARELRQERSDTDGLIESLLMNINAMKRQIKENTK